MAKKNKGNVVYSTNPDFNGWDDDDNEGVDGDISPSRQTLYLHLDRLKADKFATRVVGFQGNETALDLLARTLKTSLSVGGTVKDGQIHLQGNVRDRARQLLEKAGYKVKLAGG